MLESEKHFSSLLFKRCGTASAAVAVLLETHVAAACSLWFHPDPDLHCNEHSGQSIIHRRFTHSKKGKTNRSAVDAAGKGSRSVFCRYMKLCCEACLFCLSQFREGKVPWADTVCLRGGCTPLALHSRHKCLLSIPGLQEQSVLLRQPRLVDANTAKLMSVSRELFSLDVIVEFIHTFKRIRRS